MKEEILKCRDEVLASVVNDSNEVEAFRVKYLGKKGILNDFFARFKDVPNENKKEIGQLINELKLTVAERLEAFQQQFSASVVVHSIDDATRPANFGFHGTRHPLTIVRRRMITVFEKMGFSVEEGPEIEDDWHNFSALNFPPEHPARDMQDTFFIDTNPDIALRTHTSSVQVRVM
ncbi:MAG TPA: phenylalanine--tRNA ligase subunit alpha, partial [Bacteroidales bacterium]|nr:phenylalanine--tRNA ligase subunit alpha [Bacteroidales bacterium]